MDHGRLALGSLTSAAFAAVTTEFLPVGLLTDVAADLGVSTGTAGLAVTAPALAAAAAAPAAMLAGGRVDRRTVVLAASAVLVASNALAALAPSFAVLLVARVLLGVTIGAFWSVGPALGVRLAPDLGVGRATSLVVAGASIGVVVGVPLGSLVGEALGWRAAFGATAGLALLVLLVQARLLPPAPPGAPVRRGDLLALAGERTARVGLVLTATLVTGHFAAFTFVDPLLTGAGGPGIGEDALGGVLLAYGLAGFAGTWALGALADHRLRLTLGLTAGAVAVSAALLPFAGAPLPAVLLLTAWGFAFSGIPLGLQVWMFRAVPGAPEGGSALFVATFQVSLALGAFLGGRVVDLAGAGTALRAGALLAAAAVAVLVATAPQREEKWSSSPKTLKRFSR